MNLQFIEKAFEKTTPIFLAGVLLLLFAAMDGLTIGKNSFQINDNSWRIVIGLVGGILIIIAIYSQLKESPDVNTSKSETTQTYDNLVEIEKWEIEKFKQRLEQATDVRMIATSNYNLLSHTFVEFTDFIKKGGKMKCIYVKPESETLKFVASRNVYIESNVNHLQNQYNMTIDAIRDLSKHSTKNDSIQIKKTDYLHGAVLTLVDYHLPNGIAYVTLNGFGHHYLARPSIRISNEKHAEWFKFFVDTFEHLWDSPNCEDEIL